MKWTHDTRLKKSSYLIEIVINHKESLFYNSLFGNPFVLNKESIFLLSMFKSGVSFNELVKQYDIADLEYWINLFLKNKFIITVGFEERKHLFRYANMYLRKIFKGDNIISLGLVLTEKCNLNCSYCISRKTMSAAGVKSRSNMSWEMAKLSIDNFVSHARIFDNKELELYFGGGEPLLNWEVLSSSILYCLDEYRSEFSFTFSTNTNSVLIDKEKAEFLKKHGVIVTTSLDGLGINNDVVRYYHSGDGTFTNIKAAWAVLNKYHQPVEWFCLTLTDETINSLNDGLLDFMQKLGVTSCTVEPDIIEPLKTNPKEVAKILFAFKKKAMERGISIGGIWDKSVKNIFKKTIKERLFGCSAFTGQGITVRADGSITLCAYSEIRIGHISDLPNLFDSQSYQRLLSNRMVGNIGECKDCELEAHCLGGCFITTEYAQYVDSDMGFLYRCELFKEITRLMLKDALT